MFSNGHVEKMDDRRVRSAREEGRQRAREEDRPRQRYAYDKDGKPALQGQGLYTIRDGLFEAIMDKYYTDPTLIAYGEDVRDWDGAFAVYRGLHRGAALSPPVQLPDRRVGHRGHAP